MHSPKGAAFDILPAQSDVYAVLEKGAKGHVLSQSPVHLTILHQVRSTTQDTGHTWRTKHTNTREERCVFVCVGGGV